MYVHFELKPKIERDIQQKCPKKGKGIKVDFKTCALLEPFFVFNSKNSLLFCLQKKAKAFQLTTTGKDHVATTELREKTTTTRKENAGNLEVRKATPTTKVSDVYDPLAPDGCEKDVRLLRGVHRKKRGQLNIQCSLSTSRDMFIDKSFNIGCFHNH